ncbi:MAG: PQQ-dependent sugar dehydrogenase [Bacteroidota bacterium]
MKKLLLLNFVFLWHFASGQAPINLVPFASGLDQPVAIVNAGDSRLFIVEKPGRIMIADSNGQMISTPFLDITLEVLDNRNERGLLGLAFHPAYDQNGLFYVNYTFGDGRTRVSKFMRSTNDPNKADSTSEEVLLDVPQPFANHNAGDMAFGPDGYLYITMGDGGSGGDPGNRAQNMKDHLGKILRIDVDVPSGYGIPNDNPFVNDTSALDEIWSSGWRNPWRMSFDKLTGDMWVADVGQNQYEEVSVEWAGTPGGQNYGWRCIEGNTPFNGTGCGNANLYTPPLHTYLQGFNTGKSITGGYVYRGATYVPLQASYVFGDYESGNVWTLVPAGGGQYNLVEHGKLLGAQQISTFGQDASGELYVAAFDEGNIYQITSTTSSIDPAADPYGIDLYPNPAEDKVFVRLENPPQGSFEILIHSLNGKIVATFPALGAGKEEIILAGISSGVYLLEVKAERSAYQKLVIR